MVVDWKLGGDIPAGLRDCVVDTRSLCFDVVKEGIGLFQLVVRVHRRMVEMSPAIVPSGRVWGSCENECVLLGGVPWGGACGFGGGVVGARGIWSSDVWGLGCGGGALSSCHCMWQRKVWRDHPLLCTRASVFPKERFLGGVRGDGGCAVCARGVWGGTVDGSSWETIGGFLHRKLS